MGAEVLAFLVIAALVSDAVTHGRAGAVARGTVKGTARTARAAGRTGARRAAENHRAYLASGKAPLGRTRLATGRGARAVAAGARDGVREELAKLRAEIQRAREDLERARAAGQDPAQGLAKGRFGHSFDQPPKPAKARKRAATAPATDPDSTGARVNGYRDGPVPDLDLAAAEAGVPPDLRDELVDIDPAAPAAGTTTEGNAMTTAMTTGTTPNGSSAGGGGGGMSAESLPEFIAGVELLAKHAQALSESGVSLGIGPAAQAGLTDAIDMLRSVAGNVRAQFQPLIEAADATHVDASGLTIGAARSQ